MDDSAHILKANLHALEQRDAAFARRIAAAEPAPLDWSASRAGPWTASLAHEGRTLSLASRFDPEAEAAKLVEGIAFEQTPCLVVLGLGLGYHVQQIVRSMQGGGMVIVYEPSAALWRAVLERIDHTAWLGRANVIVGDIEMTRPELTRRVEGHGALLTQGTKLITHPASRQLHSEAFNTFGQAVTETLAFCRTNVATALVNTARTCRNLASNLDHYAAGATLDELRDIAKGWPAVCVSAGPSLARNVDLLRDPEVRRNVVLISVQTTLKPLLDRGIRPDFVTALDYSQICKRFYEDLPALPDVTLVAEPKAHPTILESFPGPIRIIRSGYNDKLLDTLVRPMAHLPSGATVAHLSFYLAQFLGCDPIIFIGQDLGFSDGLYYTPGTATHQVWSSELNPFNTVEMMEWQRIVRMKGHLQRTPDIHGQTIFTDEQMLTYLRQFERDFSTAPQTIIDATEGGAPKAHATTMTLAGALREHATQPAPALPLPPRELDVDRLDALVGLLERRLREVQDLKRTTHDTAPILKKMIQHQRDPQRMRKLFSQLQKQQRHVQSELGATFTLVSELNAVGSFRRARADRAIAYIKDTGYERQTQQIERDLENLDWLEQACDEALEIFRDALARAQASAVRARLKRKRPQMNADEHG